MKLFVTYVYSEVTGKFTFLCNSVGYGIPYATQYTNPQAAQWVHPGSSEWHLVTLPQADPNALFSPASADGTWVVCADPTKVGKVTTVYVEPKVTTVPYRLPSTIVLGDTTPTTTTRTATTETTTK